MKIYGIQHLVLSNLGMTSKYQLILNPGCGLGCTNNLLPIAIGISSYIQLYIFNQHRLWANGTFEIPNLHKGPARCMLPLFITNFLYQSYDS